MQKKKKKLKPVGKYKCSAEINNVYLLAFKEFILVFFFKFVCFDIGTNNSITETRNKVAMFCIIMDVRNNQCSVFELLTKAP